MNIDDVAYAVSECRRERDEARARVAELERQLAQAEAKALREAADHLDGDEFAGTPWEVLVALRRLADEKEAKKGLP